MLVCVCFLISKHEGERNGKKQENISVLNQQSSGREDKEGRSSGFGSVPIKKARK